MPYTLIRSARRTLALQISPTGELIVRAPRFYPKFLIDAFVQKKGGWIEKSQEKIRNRNTHKNEYSALQISQMKQNLFAYIVVRVAEIWKLHNLPPYTSIKITKSEGRWGSCSGKNGLCFSYRLAESLEASPRFIDAIIVHELAHLREKNHQKSFWDLVYRMMPEYEEVIRKAKFPHQMEEP